MLISVAAEGKRSAVFVTECTMIEPTPLIRETEVV
jgi:hypothetical protein